MTKIYLALIAIVVLIGTLLVGTALYYSQVANPRVMRELIDNPDGDRAKKVMLLSLPSGIRIPVNYLREGDQIYAGADGRWWNELTGTGATVTVLVRGELLSGRGRAVLDDPDHTSAVFARLRPDALEGFGTLVEIQLD